MLTFIYKDFITLPKNYLLTLEHFFTPNYLHLQKYYFKRFDSYKNCSKPVVVNINDKIGLIKEMKFFLLEIMVFYIDDFKNYS